jgi:hypothetical protein
VQGISVYKPAFSAFRNLAHHSFATTNKLLVKPFKLNATSLVSFGSLSSYNASGFD